MRVDYTWLLRLALVLTIITSLEARRVRVQQPQEDEDYYNDPQDDGTHRQVVLVSADEYNGIYGQQPVSRNGQDNYIPQSRASPSRSSYKDTRAQTKEVNKAPPVQTIRNYNKVNDDGSFTFGYEAADGSFKEETRGTDCVVRGKYGYVDPDGNKREFTYVSGNPCDPNAPKDEDSNERPDDVNEPENIPQNYPTRPIRPIRPVQVTTPKPVTVFHNTYVAEEDDEVEQPEPEQVLRAQPIQPTRHRILPQRPQYVQQEQPLIQRQRLYPSTTASPVTYREESRPLSITPRPITPTPSRAQPPATTYRPQLLQVAVTPRPALVYTTKQINIPQRTTHYPSSTPSSLIRERPGSAALDFVAEYQKFQTDNQITSTPAPILRTTKPTLHGDIQGSNPVYSSELVFDPASGQYKTALYQTLPQTDGDFRVNHQIQPYVHNPGPQLVNYRQLQQQSPLYRAASTQAPRTSQAASQASQAAYQQQQAELQFQNSQQLFAQQQRARAQQHQHQQPQHHAQPQQQPLRTEPQQFYYIQPQALQNGLSTGQIDAFLRGHNIQF